MNTSLSTAAASACLLAAVWIGMRLRRYHPAHHLSRDSKDTVRLAMGLVATMSALLTRSISKLMLAVLVLWLVVIFLGFSLIAPPNATATFALIASAL